MPQLVLQKVVVKPGFGLLFCFLLPPKGQWILLVMWTVLANEAIYGLNPEPMEQPVKDASKTNLLHYSLSCGVNVELVIHASCRCLWGG